MSDRGLLSGRTVWDRADYSEPATLSRRAYMLVLTASTLAGIIVASIASAYSMSWNLEGWSPWLFLGFIIAVFAATIGGSVIALRSSNPVVSATAYLGLVAIPFGLLLGPVVALYQPGLVLKVLLLTSLLVFVLGAVGAVIPKDLGDWARWIFPALVLLLIGLIGVPLLGAVGVPVGGAMTFLDWAGLLLFGAIVIFDLNRAVRLPHTVDNAIDAGMSVFVDFVNIFIRLLSIFGGRSNS